MQEFNKEKAVKMSWNKIPCTVLAYNRGQGYMKSECIFGEDVDIDIDSINSYEELMQAAKASRKLVPNADCVVDVTTKRCISLEYTILKICFRSVLIYLVEEAEYPPEGAILFDTFHILEGEEERECLYECIISEAGENIKVELAVNKGSGFKRYLSKELPLSYLVEESEDLLPVTIADADFWKIANETNVLWYIIKSLNEVGITPSTIRFAGTYCGDVFNVICK